MSWHVCSLNYDQTQHHRIHEAAIATFGIDNGSHLLDVLWQLNERASCRHLVPVKTDIDDSHRVKLCLGLHIGVSCGVQTLQTVVV